MPCRGMGPPSHRHHAGEIAPVDPPEATQQRLDDWVNAFASRLAWLGAPDDPRDLAKLGSTMYANYDLMDPYDIARRVWRRSSSDR